MDIRLGIIGVGMRGFGLGQTVQSVKGLVITAVCDLYPDRVADAVKEFSSETQSVFGTLDYHELLARKDVDAVIVSTSWDSHVTVAIDALRAKKITAMEVGGAYSVEELWELIDTYEETKTPFMFLENCCYGEFELMTTAMVRKGIFGELSHCSGAYSHDLRSEVAFGRKNRHYRLNEYMTRNRENYPTHELGPIAKILGINRGNRMVSLVSVASKQAGLREFIKENAEKLPDLQDVTFRQGDVVNTIITCENGETIALKLDTTLPRFYSREFSVHGTKGMYSHLARAVFLDGDNHDLEANAFFENDKKYLEKYSVPMWKNLSDAERELGHGGMDYFELTQFVRHIQNGEEFPIDVYDAAAWMVVACLSEESIQTGRSVAIPDFTRGAYKTRPIADVVPLE